MRVAIVATHPVQYNAPWFGKLSSEPGIDLRVFYTWSQASNGAKYDPGFGKHIEWDLPLLEGYTYHFSRNTATDPGSHHRNGIINPDLKNELKTFDPGLIIVIGWAYRSHLECLRYFKNKVPIAFRGDSTLIDERGGLKNLLRTVALRYVYKHVDYALVVGEQNKKYFRAFGLDETQLVPAPHAIDNQRFADGREDGLKIRRQLGLKEDDFLLLFAGKLEAKKNPQYLLQLAAQIDDERFHILVVGNGPLEAEIKASATADHRIHFMDFQNQRQMPAIYHACDVFILPSTGPDETWGLAMNEAMAAGKPILASRKAGGTADLVKPGETGYDIDPAQPGQTARLIRRMMSDPLLLQGMGERAKAHVQRFSFDAIVKGVRQLCKKLEHA